MVNSHGWCQGLPNLGADWIWACMRGVWEFAARASKHGAAGVELLVPTCSRG